MSKSLGYAGLVAIVLVGVAGQVVHRAVADDETVLTGRVVRLGSHEPVSGAAVTIRCGEEEAAATSTSSDGRFRLVVGAPAEGKDVVLGVVAAGCAPLYAVPPSRSTIAPEEVGDLVLEPAWFVHGTARGENGEKVAGARVRLAPTPPDEASELRAGSWVHAGVYRETTSDDDGRFAVAGIPPRSFDVEVLAEGYVTSWFRGRATADGAQLDLRLRRGTSIRVRVEDEDGEPVAGARVNLYLGYRKIFVSDYKIGLRRDRSTTTDLLGRCVLTGLRDRNHHVTAEGPRGAGAVSYVLPGWPEVVVRTKPGWRPSRYAYEDGPGDGLAYPGPRAREGAFAWLRWPPEHRSPPPPPPPPPASEPEEPEPPPPPPADQARLHVTVLSADGAPIPDLFMKLEGPASESLITEDDGTECELLLPGRYAWRASPIGYGTEAADVRGTVEVEGGTETRLVVRMPRIWSVPVEVRTAEGRAVPWASVEVWRGTESKRERAEEDGRLVLFAEEGQPLSLLARPPGEAAAVLEQVSVPVDGPLILHAPKPASGVRGRVLAPEGTPVFGVRVEARREGLAPLGEETWETWTNDRGEFVFERPTAAPYEVVASHPAFAEATAHVEVGPETEPLTLRLEVLRRLAGRVVDEQGAPIARAEIEVREPGDDRGYGWVGSGDDGRFEIVLPRGEESAELLVRHEGCAPRVVPVEPGGVEALEIRLAKE